MRKRKSSRIIVLDKNNKILLFHFVNKQVTHAGRSCWATPGGEIEKGETIEQAAKRELYEETGFYIDIDTIGKPIWRNEFIFRLDDGEEVMAWDIFFVIHVLSSMKKPSRANWTQQELEAILDYKWWSIKELQANTFNETIYPENLVGLLKKIISNK